MTSHVVSRGRLAPLVGKRVLAVGLCVHFARTQSLFAFILLTHMIVILGIGHRVDGSFYCVTIQKNGKRRKTWLNAFSCKQCGSRS